MDTYLARVADTTGTRFWVNNPTLAEIDLALANGVAGCTTNPSYGGSLARRAPDELLPIIRECVGASSDDRVVAGLVQERLVARIASHFGDLYRTSSGLLGFVSIQGSPEVDDDPAHILAEAMRAREIAPNVAPKIPATGAGLAALDEVVAMGHPVIVTEVFSVAQLIETCERWLAASSNLDERRPFFISPITGIFGDHLKKLDASQRSGIDRGAIELAGVILARQCYRVVTERGYPCTLLFGGARLAHDFTGLVGGRMAATLNWSTLSELLEADPTVAVTIVDDPDPGVVELLASAFEDFRRALDPSGLSLEEYASFGPVQHFRSVFLDGWRTVVELVSDTRRML